jgi:hypothetical protein
VKSEISSCCHASAALAVLHRNALARVMVHLHRLLDTVETIPHVVADLLLVRVVNRLAVLLGRLIGIALLHPILDAVGGVAANRCTRQRRDLALVAVTDLIAAHTADDCTDDGARDLVLILGFRHFLNLVIGLSD